VLFDGVPAVVHLEEPRVGVQFGVVLKESGGAMRGFVVPRNAQTAQDVPDPNPPSDPQEPGSNWVRVRFRRGGPGVLHLARLDADLRATAGTNLGGDVDSAEFALEMLRFPFRAVFGDQGATVPEPPFAPQVSTQVLREVYTKALRT
jgi:hypothetical protein